MIQDQKKKSVNSKHASAKKFFDDKLQDSLGIESHGYQPGAPGYCGSGQSHHICLNKVGDLKTILQIKPRQSTRT